MAVNERHPDYKANIVTWKRNRAFFNGNDAVKEGGKTYLPATEFDGDDDYNVYLKYAPLFPATSRTVDALSGLATRKPSTITLPQDQEVDGYLPMGTSKEVFEQSTIKELLLMGRIGYLVDKSLFEPFKTTINIYNAETIINWRYENNKLILLVLEETVNEVDPKDIYKVTPVTQYRECYMDEGVYKQRLWRKSNKPGPEFIHSGEVVPLNKNKTLDTIPFVMLNSTKEGPEVEKAPLTDLVTNNNYHYQTSANHSYILRKIAIPVLGIFGEKFDEDTAFVMGGMIDFQNPDTNAEWLEVKGTGVKYIVDHLKELKKEMATLGSKLIDNTRQNETAETVMLHQGSENSSLLTVINSLQDGFTQALKFVMQWELQPASYEAQKDDIDVSISHDLVTIKMQPSEIKELLATYMSGAISQDTFLANLQSGEILLTEIDDEKKKIEEEKPDPVDPVVIEDVEPEE